MAKLRFSEPFFPTFRRAAAVTEAPLQEEFPKEQLPRHVAIIMDGNRRWASERRLPAAEGHRRGRRALSTIVEEVYNLGIERLTVYGFSTENWKRTPLERSLLFQLFESTITEELPKLREHSIRLCFIGDRSGFPPSLRQAMDHVEGETLDHKRLTMTVALSYGGQAEIAAAVKGLAEQVKAGRLDPAAIDAGLLEGSIQSSFLGPVDLLIRTGGEVRISNFMLWSSAYAELYFSPLYWPDFTPEELRESLREFMRRQRRYGS